VLAVFMVETAFVT